MVHFEYPCETGGSITAALMLNIRMDSITVDDAGASAIWYCGDAAPINNYTTAKYAASVDLIQIDSFAILNVAIEVVTYEHPKYGDYMTGSVSGMIELGPLSITAAVMFDTRPDGKTVIAATLDLDIADGIHLSGQGRVSLPCRKMGDLAVDIQLTFQDLGMEFLDNIEAIGSFR